MLKFIAGLSLAAVFSFGSEIAVLKSVVDGDTLYFKSGGEEINCRIAYIDTPESKENKKASKDASKCAGITSGRMVQFGKEATTFAKSFMKIGDKYKIYENGKDQYGRSICIVETPFGLFNEIMVGEGYAVPFMEYIKENDVKERYEKLLQHAKSNKKGVWGKDPSVMNCLLR